MPHGISLYSLLKIINENMLFVNGLETNEPINSEIFRRFLSIVIFNIAEKLAGNSNRLARNSLQ